MTQSTQQRGRALITGGCGFIGSHLADAILASGDEVVVVDSLVRTGSERNLARLRARHPQGFTFIRGDIRDKEIFPKLLHDVDVIAPNFGGINIKGGADLDVADTESTEHRVHQARHLGAIFNVSIKAQALHKRGRAMANSDDRNPDGAVRHNLVLLVSCTFRQTLKPVYGSAELREWNIHEVGKLHRESTSVGGGSMATASGTKKKSASASKNAPANGFMKPLKPSKELAEIVGDEPLPRSEAVSKMWAYIKKHKLQNEKNKREILADDKLEAVFDHKSKVNMFEMNKHLARHLK